MQGFWTLNLNAVHFVQMFQSATTTTYTVNIYGVNPETGVSTPTILDPVTNAVTTPGTQIYLYRTNKEIIGIAYYKVTATTTTTDTGAAAGAAQGTTTTTTTGAVKFVGHVNTNGSVDGDFYAINPDGTKLQNVFKNPNTGLISGKFSS